MNKPLKKGLEKYRKIVNACAKKAGLIVGTDLDGNFELKKKFSEDNIAQVVGIRLVKEGYISINISYERIIDDVNNEIAKSIIENGDDVILINSDIKDKNIGGLIIFDTSKET